MQSTMIAKCTSSIVPYSAPVWALEHNGGSPPFNGNVNALRFSCHLLYQSEITLVSYRLTFFPNFLTIGYYKFNLKISDIFVGAAITAGGRRSMLKLAQRMTANFCAGVCASTVHKWNKLNAGSVDEDVRVMTRKSVDDPGEPPGIVLSAATSVWLPVSPQRLFDFLRDERLRSEWDILSNGGPMQEMAHIAKGQDHGNCVSLLRASVLFLSSLIIFFFWRNSVLFLSMTFFCMVSLST